MHYRFFISGRVADFLIYLEHLDGIGKSCFPENADFVNVRVLREIYIPFFTFVPVFVLYRELAIELLLPFVM